ncbi:MAG: twin-arginine translocase subunit TatC [Bacteroidota bacterium]|nr:twin-arginine translocase subunit TatC [Bacteroidota bacterium]
MKKSSKSKRISSSDENLDEMSFFDHLEALRWHILRSVVVVIIFAIVAFIFKSFVFDSVILAPKESYFPTNRFFCHFAEKFNKDILCINQNPLKLINIKITGQFVIHITISLIAGLIIAFPYIIFELWKFIKPALFKNERKTARFSIFMISLLFFMGVLLGYYLIVPISLNFLSNYIVSSAIENTINLRSYITTLSSICFASGIIFELPVITYFLSKLGLVTPDVMKKFRRHAIVVILILSSILTPPDMVSQFLIAIPLFLLYEISIKISARVVKKIE